jgi:hypothetical protein
MDVQIKAQRTMEFLNAAEQATLERLRLLPNVEEDWLIATPGS